MNTTLDRVHFVGVGGAGMSAAARLLAAEGRRVTGSDGSPGAGVTLLRTAGIPVVLGHRAEHLPVDATCVVRTLAVPDENPEVAAARARGLAVLTYPELLGAMMCGRTGVAVAGTHGKSTTTGMLTQILCHAGFDPSVVLGAELSTIGGASRAGRGDCFVVEACEYREAFQALAPRVVLLNNVEHDHMDCYPTLADVEAAFGRFVARLPRDGVLVANADDDAVMRVVVRHAACRVVTFGLDTRASVDGTVTALKREAVRFLVHHERELLGEATLRVPGRHNVRNALGAVATALALGARPADILAGLAAFPGVGRRFEVVGEGAGVTVVDDYAHHPTAVRVVLEAARARYPLRRLVALFQPHQGSRTRALFDDFARALALADTVVLPEIFYAREGAEERARVSSRDLADAVTRLGVPATFVPDVDRCLDAVLPGVRAGDVVIVMGAGNIAGTAQRLVASLRARDLTRRDALPTMRLTPSGRLETTGLAA